MESEISSKRRRTNRNDFAEVGIVLYFLPARIQKKRLEVMKNTAKSSGYDVATSLSNTVTHIVSEFEDEEQVIKSLKMNTEDWLSNPHPEIVNTKWFAECVKQKRTVPIETQHRLKPCKEKQAVLMDEQNDTCHQSYACQRANPLAHHNHKLTDILEILAEAAELKNDEINASRALAFRRSAAVLKSLPYKLTDAAEVENLKDIGKHSLSVIKEVLERNCCEESLKVQTSEWFCTVKLFNSVFGVGPVTANKWYNLGLRTLDDVKSTPSLNWRKNDRITYGLALYKDLATPILRKEADKIFSIIEKEAKDILPGAILHLTGGFRRGKTEGHDVDILLSHLVEGEEVGLLASLLGRLKEMGHVLYGKIEKTNTRVKSTNNTMDTFEKCFLIYIDYFDSNICETRKAITENPDADILFEVTSKPRNWIARRVDLVLCPYSELTFALVGWTGNRHFNRSLRNYAKKEKNMRLTSHALYDLKQHRCLTASTEEELFHHLDLCYRDPYYRNA